MPERSAPLPSQIHTWLPERSGFDGTARLSAKPEWLRCLRDTAPGDRLLVWSGRDGRGLIAVVDFSGEVRQCSEVSPSSGCYEGWGVVTNLVRPISATDALAHPVISRALKGSIQRPRRLSADAGEAVEALAELPPTARIADPADWAQPGGDWAARRLPPERIVEEIVLNRRRVARRLGFPERVNPDGKKKRLANGTYPDLWCAQGVVGDAKNQVSAKWGPEQIAGYIDECNRQWPRAGGWRGILVQGEREMAPNALPALKKNRHAKQIEVWHVSERRLVGHRIERLYP